MAALQFANRRDISRGAPVPAVGPLLVPKPEVKEEDEDEEATKATNMAEYLHRVTANLDDCPGLNAAFMALLNDTDAWRGDTDEAISMSIRDAGMPLVDLTHDGEAGPSGAVKDEPIDEPNK
jgi:hypothetical protein